MFYGCYNSIKAILILQLTRIKNSPICLRLYLTSEMQHFGPDVPPDAADDSKRKLNSALYKSQSTALKHQAKTAATKLCS